MKLSELLPFKVSSVTDILSYLFQVEGDLTSTKSVGATFRITDSTVRNG